MVNGPSEILLWSRYRGLPQQYTKRECAPLSLLCGWGSTLSPTIGYIQTGLSQGSCNQFQLKLGSPCTPIMLPCSRAHPRRLSESSVAVFVNVLGPGGREHAQNESLYRSESLVDMDAKTPWAPSTKHNCSVVECSANPMPSQVAHPTETINITRIQNFAP